MVLPSAVFTVGTWRVGVEAYAEELARLKVARVLDIRGNPYAGRQKDLWKGKPLEDALRFKGIAYEYYGDQFGEEPLEKVDQAPDERARIGARLREIIFEPPAPRQAKKRNDPSSSTGAAAAAVCLLGHMHEPQGCHRLRLCELLLQALQGGEADGKAALRVEHLLWADHKSVRHVSHAEVSREAREKLRFFDEEIAEARKERRARDVATSPLPPPPATKDVPWSEFRQGLLEDGNSYRFLLPFDTELFWYPSFLGKAEADALEETVRDRVTFYHPTYVFQSPDGSMSKTLIRRGQARVCAPSCPGTESQETVDLEDWSEKLLHQVERAGGPNCVFNCFVGNDYRDGTVMINWHTDSGPGDDEGLGPNPEIGSMSLGAVRTFCLKSKRKWPDSRGRFLHLDIPLPHGSLLIMGRNSQTHWLHSLPADDHVSASRVNLTFRFYARLGEGHVEGVEHNHEWETAKGSTRVLLHRQAPLRPCFVDLPDDITVGAAAKLVTAVLPGDRPRPNQVRLRVRTGAGKEDWRLLDRDEKVVPSLLRPKNATAATTNSGQPRHPELVAEVDDVKGNGKGGVERREKGKVKGKGGAGTGETSNSSGSSSKGKGKGKDKGKKGYEDSRNEQQSSYYKSPQAQQGKGTGRSTPAAEGKGYASGGGAWGKKDTTASSQNRKGGDDWPALAMGA